MVYLLHFDRPFHHAKHYIGYTDEKLDQRMERHRSGQGARIIKAVIEAGIGFQVARVWENGDRNFERKLKNQKKSSRLCPICKEEHKGEILNG